MVWPMISGLLPPFDEITFEDLQDDSNCFSIKLRLTKQSSVCPECGVVNERVHSNYVRHLQDLPWAGKPVHIRLVARKFFCDNHECVRTIFTERISSQLPSYSRRTTRLNTVLQQIGCKTGANPGASIAHIVGITISASSVLRLLHKVETPSHDVPPTVIGVDDWAWRKGHRYGTIIVDHQKGRVIDLLPDRETQTLKAWLREHPEITTVTRDRASCYATAIREAAPEAIQIADRWHLLKNLGDALKKVLEKYNRELKQSAQMITYGTTCATKEEEDTQQQSEMEESTSTDPSPSRQELLFEQVKSLLRAGHSIRAVARQTGVSRNTVRRYACYDFYPKRNHTSSNSTVMPYIAYVAKRWNEGEKRSRQLWQEITDQGYTGSVSSVYRAIRNLTGYSVSHPGITELPKAKAWSTRKVSLLMSRELEKLEPEQKEYLKTLYSLCPSVKQAGTLALEFKQLMMNKKGDKLDQWITQVRNSGIKALKNFTTGLSQDYAAVKAACDESLSNGRVEGHVNRLKNIKRRMYGRAGFCLLRKCVLADTS